MRTHTPRQLVLAIHLSLLAPALFVVITGCDSAVRKASREAKPLAYVGQIQFGQSVKENGLVVVPLKYHGGEWGQNSAIVPIGVEFTVKDMEIDITVVTSVATDATAKDGYRLVLPTDAKGKHKVHYLDPDGTRHEIGVLEIND